MGAGGGTVAPAYLGILADRQGSGRPFYEQTRFIAGLLAAARSMGIPAYAFGPLDVSPAGTRVRGWALAGGRWTAAPRPRPALVYDRFFLHTPGPRGREVLRAYRRLVRLPWWRPLGVQAMDKLRVYRALRSDPVLRPHLPPTRPCHGPEAVRAALADWGAVVLKPVHGGKGEGIWFLRRRRDGGLRLHAGATPRHRDLDPAEAAAWLRGRLGSRRYLVQPWLDLRVWEGRVADLRVLVQRDGDGLLRVTGGGARVGAEGCRVANLHRGGRAVPLGAVLGPAGRSPEEACHLALRAAGILDGRLGPLAEVGVDLALDRQGRLWILELNTRPGRAIFRRLGDWQARRLAVRRPLAYAAFLLAGGQPPRGLAACPGLPAAAPADP